MADRCAVAIVLATDHDPSDDVGFLDPTFSPVGWVFWIGFLDLGKSCQYKGRQHFKVHGASGHLIKGFIDRTL